jgi:hypothetical protein
VSLRISEALHKASVHSGVLEKELANKRMVLTDAKKFIQQVIREHESTVYWASVVEIVGFTFHSIAFVCDIIVDSVTGSPQGKKVPTLIVIRKAFEAAREKKFDGARHSDVIKKIDLAQKALEKALGEELSMVASVFGNMAKNTVGFLGFMEDSKDTKTSLATSRRNLTQSLRQLEAKIQEIDELLAKQAAARSPVAPEPEGNVTVGPLR